MGVGHTLTARTYLGDNTVPILRDICALLTSRGIDVEMTDDPPGSAPDAAAHAHEFDLVWACGLMTLELIASGALEADIVAAPVFTGESTPTYHSVILAHPDTRYASLSDAVGGRLAINEEESWSGHHGLLSHMNESGLPEFAAVVWSGSHEKSARALLAGEADVAAIDSTVWNYLVESDPALGALQVIDRTMDWPAPPFSVRRSIDAEVRARLTQALTAVGPGDVVGLERIDLTSATTYATMRRNE